MNDRRETVAEAVVTTDNLAAILAERHGARHGERLRLAFVAGPGDAAGTFDHWMRDEHDPRVPVITYSTQFYVLAERIEAEALVITEPANQPEKSHPLIRFTQVPRDRSRHGLGWHIAQHRYALAVLRELRRFRPQVAILSPDLPAWTLAALPRGTELVLSLHNTFWPMGQRPRSPKRLLRQALMGAALRRMSTAVCTSAECARQLSALTGRHAGIFVETPQIPLRHVALPRQRDRARRLLFLGRIEADKGVFDLLQAFEALAPDHPDLTLTFAGHGSADTALAEAVTRSQWRNRITLAGLLPAAQVHAALQASDLLVCPTRSAFNEGLALVAVEAAAQGVPSVLSTVVPARDLVADGCVTFAADDVVDLTRTLGSLVADPARYRALAAGTGACRAQLFDRSRSWGSMLAQALTWRRNES